MAKKCGSRREREAAKATSASVAKKPGRRCADCAKGGITVTGSRRNGVAVVCSDCYFTSIAALVESSPIRSKG